MKLRSLIEDKDVTQKQVAVDLSIAPSTMGGYVQGSSEPDFDTLRRIAKYFNVSTDYLLDIQTGKAVSNMEDELLRVFRAMKTEQHGIFIEQGKVFVKANYKEKKN